MTEILLNSLVRMLTPQHVGFWKWVNVNGLEPVLNPWPLSQRADKPYTTPRSDNMEFPKSLIQPPSPKACIFWWVSKYHPNKVSLSKSYFNHFTSILKKVLACKIKRLIISKHHGKRHFWCKATSNLGLKFWWWALETITHRFYPQDFEFKIRHST